MILCHQQFRRQPRIATTTATNGKINPIGDEIGDLRRLRRRCRCAAAIDTLIETAKLNNVDPQAWLTDVLTRLQDHPAKRIAELQPWKWNNQPPQMAAA